MRIKELNQSQIIYPSSPLSRYVKYYWVLYVDGVNNMIQTIPSGCLHLVFHRGSGFHFSNGGMQPHNFIRGQLTGHAKLFCRGHIDMIAVVFHPLGLNRFISLPLNQIYNQYIDIDSIGDVELRNLKRDISNQEDTLACVRYIENFLLTRIDDSNSYNYNRISNSIQLIQQQTEIDVSTLADKACLGYRHFKREFSKYVGIAPKEYLRVIRFQKVLHSMQMKPDTEIGELAYICGFYDHSHLVKEFKSMSGCSPTEYLLSRKPHSTFYSDSSRLNLIRTNLI